MANWVPASTKVRYAQTKSLDPASVAAATIVDQNFTVTGLRTNLPVFAWFKSTKASANIFLLAAHCFAANTLTLTLQNNHATNAVDLAATDFLIWQP